MDDSEGIGGMLSFQGADLLGGDDIKSILWDDGPDVSFENLSSEHQGENDMLNLISAGLSPSNSSDTLQEDSEMNKKVVLAAASAAGLNKGGIRRAAFSMGDLQALQPAEPKQEPMQTFSTGLETVHEGQPALLSALPHVRVVHTSHHPHQQQQQQQQLQQPLQPQQPQQQQPPPQQQQPPPQHYVLMPLHEAAARGSTPTQLASMSIEEIEAQLRRTREAAAASAEHARPGLVQVPAGIAMPSGSQPMRYYTVMPSTGALQELQPSQLVSLMQQQPSTSGAPGPIPVPVSVPLSVPMTAAHLHAPRTVTMAAAPAVMAPAMSSPSMRRTKSAVDLRPNTGNEEEQQAAAPVALQATVPGEGPIPDDGVYRIGKLTLEERRQKILRYRQKRHERNFKKKIKYVCRKTLADTRPRVRGRFARNTDTDAKMPPATGSEVPN